LGGALVDLILPVAGQVFTNAANVYIGQGPGNSVILPVGLYLLPGDVLVTALDAGTGNFTAELLQEPL